MSKSPQQRIDELEKQAADMQTELQQLRDLLPLEQTSNPWEDGRIYRFVRQWVVDNPDKRALELHQDMDNEVFLVYATTGPGSHYREYVKIGTFPEHPAGWRNSATPLPPVPPVETWPQFSIGYCVETGGTAQIDTGATHPDNTAVWHEFDIYPPALCEAWQFTRTELEASRD